MVLVGCVRLRGGRVAVVRSDSDAPPPKQLRPKAQPSTDLHKGSPGSQSVQSSPAQFILISSIIYFVFNYI